MNVHPLITHELVCANIIHTGFCKFVLQQNAAKTVPCHYNVNTYSVPAICMRADCLLSSSLMLHQHMSPPIENGILLSIFTLDCSRPIELEIIVSDCKAFIVW